MNYNYFIKIITELWEEPTTLYAIARDICFLFVSAFAFYFFTLCAGYISGNAIVTELAITQVNFGLAWSNVFINVMTILVIAEVSSYIAKAYWDYRRDNL